MSTPPHEHLTEKALTWTQQVHALRIVDEASYSIAAEMIIAVSALLREAESIFGEPRKKAHEAHQAIIAAEKKVTEPLNLARDLLKRMMTGYIQEQLDRVEEENRRLRTEADRKHEEEIAAQIAEAQRNGATDYELREIRTQPSLLPSTTLTAVPKLRGIATKQDWRVEITSKRKFVEAALDDPQLMELIQINEGALNSLARTYKHAFSVPGCRLVSSSTLSVTPKRGLTQ